MNFEIYNLGVIVLALTPFLSYMPISFTAFL